MGDKQWHGKRLSLLPKVTWQIGGGVIINTIYYQGNKWV